MGKPKTKVKIKMKQKASLRPTTQKSNIGNLGRHTLLANCGNIKLKVKKKNNG